MKKISLSILAVLALVCFASVAEARICIKRGRCVRIDPTPPAPPSPPRLGGEIRFLPNADFTIDASGIKPGGNAQFAFAIVGETATVATLLGDKVTFTAKCRVKLPAENYNALATPLLTTKPVLVVLTSAVKEDGIVWFDRADVFEEMRKRLQKVRFWDQDASFALENLKITITGVARIDGMFFRTSNDMTFCGKVD